MLCMHANKLVPEMCCGRAQSKQLALSAHSPAALPQLPQDADLAIHPVPDIHLYI